MKKTIRLTESDLHRIIKESVRKVLKEEETKGGFVNIDGKNVEWREKSSDWGSDWTNHNAAASQSSIDNDYEYEGQLWDEENGHGAYLVSKRFDENSDLLYNIEDEDTEELIFPQWFELPYGDNTPESWIDDQHIYVRINGKDYAANWLTGKFEPIK